MTKDQRHVHVCERRRLNQTTLGKKKKKKTRCVFKQHALSNTTATQTAARDLQESAPLWSESCYRNCRVTTIYGSYSNSRALSGSFVIDIQGFSAINLSFLTANTGRVYSSTLLEHVALTFYTSIKQKKSFMCKNTRVTTFNTAETTD